MNLVHTNGIQDKWKPRKPHTVLDTIRRQHKLRNDRELCDFLDMQASVISRIRSGKMAMSAEVILTVHETTGMPIAVIKAMLKSEQT